LSHKNGNIDYILNLPAETVPRHEREDVATRREIVNREGEVLVGHPRPISVIYTVAVDCEI